MAVLKKREEGIKYFIISVFIVLTLFLIYFVSATYITTPYTSNSCLVNSRDNITIYGDTLGASIKFTSALSNGTGEYTLRYALDSDNTLDTSLVRVNLTYFAGRKISIKEGENAYANDYIIINSGDKGRILRVASIQANTSTNNKVILSDIITSETFNFATGLGQAATTNIDGQAYSLFANNTDSTDTNRFVNITWGGAGTTTLFPRIMLNKSEWFAILYETNVTNATVYALPGEYLLSDYETGATLGANLSKGNSKVGVVNWSITNADANGASGLLTGIDTNNDGTIDCNFNSSFGPAILLLEGQNSVFNASAICIPLTSEGTNPKNPAVALPNFTEGSISFRQITSNLNEFQAIDNYGTFLRYDNSSQNNLTMSYPYIWMADSTLFDPSSGYTCYQYLISEDSGQILNITLNNTSPLANSNITQVNITLPSSVLFISNSNGTTATASFTNTSNVLSWTSSTGVVMNLSTTNFWFRTDSNTSGTYRMNVTSLNATGFETFGITFTVNDTTNPSISFVSPTLSSGSSYDQASVYANLSISDNNAISLALINLYNSTGLVNTTSGNSSYIFVNFTALPYGKYYLNATVNDTNGNINNSETRTITLAAASTDSGSTGGGGGGGGASTTSTYTLNADQSLEGISKNLGVGDKINFVITNESHVLNLTQINTDSVIIVVRSDPMTVSLALGETKKLSISSSSYYDLLVKLESISGSKANVTMKTIQELIPVTTTTPLSLGSQQASSNPSNLSNTQNEKNINLLVPAIILVLIIIIIGVFYYFYKKMHPTTLPIPTSWKRY